MEGILMSRPKRFLSLLMVMVLILSTVSIGLSTMAVGAQSQSVNPFSASEFRRPAPSVTLDVTDVTRVGASNDTMGSGTTIKRATPSGVPFITGTYASQAYDGETPVWPSIAFASSVPVNVVSVSITGASASPTLTSGGLSNTTSVSWEIRGGTAEAGSLMKIAITYTYTWNNQYTGVSVTDTYTTSGYSYVENVIFPAGIWAFASAYGNIDNAADVPYVGRLLGKGVYGNTIGEAADGGEYSSGYHDFSTNSRVNDGDTTIPKKTMLIANPDKLGAYDQYIADGQGTYASGDSRRAKTTVFLDTSVQTLQSNNFRMHFFIHTTPRSTNSNRDLTYETIHVRDGDVGYTGATGNVLGTSSTGALAALNPTGPVDGSVATGGGFLSAGMQTRSTLYGTGAAGSYTLVTQWTGRGDLPGTGTPNWMQFYHAVTVEIVRVTKATLRAALNTSIGTTTKAVSGASGVTTIVTANGTDPETGGISNNGKGKNPQSWYYSAGWNLFSGYYDDAWKTINKPNADQTLINTAVNNLNGGYISLVLAGANYSNRTSQFLTSGLGNTYYNSSVNPLDTIITAIQTADTNFSPKLRNWKAGQYGYYTTASRTALEEAFAAATAAKNENYNVLFQPYVDYCAQQLQNAVNNLVFKPNTVSFNANGGAGAMDNQTIEAGTSANLTANSFAYNGYTFAGWATTAGGNVVYANGASLAMGENSVTLYAKWNANSYTVTYNGNGNSGGSTIPSEHTFDIAKTLNANGFTRVGYTFVGWGIGPMDTTPAYVNQANVINLVSQQGGTITLYAIWTPTVYNIVYDANGGTGTMSNQTLAYLSSAPLRPNNYILTGKTFRGWSTTQANADAGIVAYADGAVYTMSTPDNKTLYAAWNSSSYTISFNPNAGGVTGSMPPQNLPFGQTANLNANTYARLGYVFLGWANTQFGAKAFNDGASFTMNSEGANLYAKWDPIVYSVVYNANGGSSAPAPNPATYDVSFVIPSSEPIRAGYSFLGWALSPTAGTTDFVSDQSVINLTINNGATINLYAIWQPNTNTTYKVEHYQENLVGGYTLYETTTQIGTTAAIGVASYKTFQGFVSNTTYPSSLSSGLILGNGSLILRVYYDRVSYLISFNTNGGSAISSINGKFGTPINAPANPTRTGYTFNGWSPIMPSTMPAANLSLNAQWSANQYNIVYNGNGATSGTMPAQSITFGSSTVLSLNSFIRSGYVFNGWSTTPAGGKEYNDGTGFSMQTTGIILYAVWIPATGTGFKVEHYLQSISGASYSVGQTTIQTGTTGDIGWAQWQSIPGFTTNPGHAGNLVAGIIAGDGSLTLRLYYTRNTATITFSGVEGINPITAKVGESVTGPAAPSRTGYTFNGWAKDEQLTQIVTWPYQMEAFNSTFYAKWTPNNYTVSFDPTGGRINNTTGIKSSTVSYGNTYAAGTLGFPTPVKTGYTFNGWFTSASIQIFSDTVVQMTAAQTLAASWTINSYTVSYDLNGGTGVPPQPVTNVYGTPVILPTSGYANAKPGFSFLGWNTSSSATASLGSFSIPEGGATLYAVWQVRSYTVSFNLNGGTGAVPASVTATFGTAVDISMTGFSKTGHTFGGWATSTNATIADRLTSYTVQSANSTLYAIWVPNSHTITLFSNGGTGPTSVQIQTEVNATVDLSNYNNYSKTGYQFIGWNTSQTASTGFWSYQAPTTSTTLLFAIYVPIENVTVSFNLNGGSGSVPNGQTGSPGTAVTLPSQGNITRQYYNFLGWSTSPTATTPLVSYTISSVNTTLYAVWGRVPVTLMAKSGSATVLDENKGFIYGVQPGTTVGGFADNYVQLTGDGELRFTYHSVAFGTGTKVELVDKATSVVLKTYYIVIFGDVNGDGAVNTADAGLVRSAASYQSALEEGSIFHYVADINGDGIVDALDVNLIYAYIHQVGTINQTKAST
jgi:uncharacterized repeat protein (TIGR02543 family)